MAASRTRSCLTDLGTQIAPLSYPHLGHTEIFDSVETFYKQFYFRAPKIASIVGEMVRSPEMMKRRLREGVEFFRFLRERRDARRLIDIIGSGGSSPACTAWRGGPIRIG